MEYKYPEYIKKLSVKGSVFGLETMQRLLNLLGHPEEDLKIIHTAGTNGKGSTLAFLAQILMESGYRVGRYISPTVICYEERFQINGIFMEKDRLESYFQSVMEAYHKMEEMGWPTPTIFEAETAIALMFFKEENVDYALVECGMGGLTDATNAIAHPFLTMITSISEDHKGFLGDTVEKIAEQKAGIIKAGAPLVLAINPENIQKTIAKISKNVHESAEEREKDIFLKENDIRVIEETPMGSTFSNEGENYEIMLPGAHQMQNALTALTAAKMLQHMESGERITLEHMKNGLKNTRWPGRLELISTQPPFYLDGAHNPDGAYRLAAFLEKHFTNKRIVYIMGVLGDKEYDLMLSYLMPLGSAVYVFKPDNPRGLSAEKLAEAMKSYGYLSVTVCDGVKDAVEQARRNEKDADCFVLCGSLSFIEDFRSEGQF